MDSDLQPAQYQEGIHPHHVLLPDLEDDLRDDGIVRQAGSVEGQDGAVLPVCEPIAQVEGGGSGVERASDIRVLTRFKDITISRACRPKPGAGEVLLFKDIRCAGTGGRVVVLVPVQSRGAAVFMVRTDHHRIPINSNRGAKLIPCPGVGGFQISLLAPGRAAAREDIGCTGSDAELLF